jgi:predicted TIM-barrel fold metal-dependent hydrolase
MVGATRILFGSDFPFLSQKRCLREAEKAPLDDEARRLILGENARRLLGLR